MVPRLAEIGRFSCLYYTKIRRLLSTTFATGNELRAHPRIVQPLRDAWTPHCRPTLLPTRISAVPTGENQPPRSHAAPPKVLSRAHRPVKASMCGASHRARRGGDAQEHFRGSEGILTPVRTGERAPSCDLASQSSSLRSSGNLTASPQVHFARASKSCRGCPRNAVRAAPPRSALLANCALTRFADVPMHLYYENQGNARNCPKKISGDLPRHGLM